MHAETGKGQKSWGFVDFEVGEASDQRVYGYQVAL